MLITLIEIYVEFQTVIEITIIHSKFKSLRYNIITRINIVRRNKINNIAN